MAIEAPMTRVAMVIYMAIFAGDCSSSCYSGAMRSADSIYLGVSNRWSMCHPDPTNSRVACFGLISNGVGMRIAPQKPPVPANKLRITVMSFGPTYCKFIGDMHRINGGAIYGEISLRPETSQIHTTMPHAPRDVWIPRTRTTEVAHKSTCCSLICVKQFI